MASSIKLSIVSAMCMLCACAELTTRPKQQVAELAGTSWQLVGFVGGDDTKRAPDDRGKYVIQLNADGSVNLRVDCNRGRGTWKSNASGQIEFGSLALRRATCPPDSLHDQLVKHWPFIRSYVVQNGHLFLSLNGRWRNLRV